MKKNKPPSQNSILLDQFSDTDIRTWNRISELSEEYHVKLFYHLESLRKINHDILCKALQDTTSLNLSADNWWRFVDHRYSNTPLSSTGSLIKGARFNIGNDLDAVGFKPFPALYIASSEETAKTEKFGATKAANGLENHELALRTPSSYTAIRIKFNLHNIFDLTKTNNLLTFTQIISKFQLSKELKELAKELKIKPPYLISKPSQLKAVLLANEWKYYPVQHEIPANSQLFGRMLRDAGFEAILFPSTKVAKSKNLAIFTENLNKSESFVALQDPTPDSVKFSKLECTNWKELSS